MTSVGIGVDVGTTNVKVAAVDEDGRGLAVASRPLTTEVDGEVAEQDAEALWAAVTSAVREVVASLPHDAPVVVGVCSQYSSIVPVDERCHPVGRLVTYLDTRGTDLSWGIIEQHPDAFTTWIERHGIPPVGGGLSLAHLLHLQQDADVHARTAAYLEPMDYVTSRLTGRIGATQATQFMTQLCDNREVGHQRYDDDLVRMSGVDASKLPPLLPLGGLAGELTAEVAGETGLAVGTPVQVGMNDSHAGAFATGAVSQGGAGVMIGSTAVLLAPVDGLATDLDHELLAMPAPLPDRYLLWAENGMAGKVVEHVLAHVLLCGDELAPGPAGDPFARLDDALRASPAGAGGLLFLPWLAGSLSPRADRGQRGSLIGMSLETRRVDVVRAVVEGVAHNLRWLLPAAEAFCGRTFDEVVLGGGAARSTEWARILADVLGRPVSVLADPDGAAARAVAWVALQTHRGEDPTDHAPQIAARFEPRPAEAALHSARHEAYVEAFDATRPLVARLTQAD